MIRSILDKIAAKLSIRPIYHRHGLYLKRYYVGQFPSFLGGWRVYLHHFLLDDPDGLHNHPWKYGLSLILAGWYWEERRWGRCKVRWLNVVNGDTMHRVILDATRHKALGLIYNDAWSLFIHSPRVAIWGFIDEFKESMFVEVSHKRYTEDPYHSICYQNALGIYKQGENTKQKNPPTPYSDWHLTAPTGAEWEAFNSTLDKELK